MIAQGLLVLCAVAYSQGFLFNPAPPRWIPVPIYKPAPKVIVKHVPIVKRVRVPVYIHREISVPQYIDRPYPVPVGGGVSQGGVSGGGAGASIGSFGLDAKIEDADTVNIVAGVSGFGGSNNNNGFNNNNFNNNDDGFGRSLGGASFGRQQIQPRVSVSQTQISQPSVRVSQPQIGGHGVHGGHGGHGGHGTKGFGHF